LLEEESSAEEAVRRATHGLFDRKVLMFIGPCG
jgi:hypothetical protein